MPKKIKTHRTNFEKIHYDKIGHNIFSKKKG